MKRQRQRGGAIVILVSQVSVALAILAIFTLYLGRWLNQQEEAGNQADALSLAAMEIARNEGISDIAQLCAHPAMQRLLHDLNGNRTAQFRGNCGRFVEIRNPDGTITLHFQVNTESQLEVGPLAERYVQGQVFPLQATAKAAITQENFDEAERRRYKLVLVLDFSGSMTRGFGAGGSRIDVLKRAVNGLLDRDFEIDYGMVMFSSDVIDSVAIGPNAPNRIRQEIRRDADGDTNYNAAINATRGLFNAVDDFGENVLFISDGAPSVGGDAYPNVDRLRDSGVTFFTLNIGGGGDQAELLKDMSGSRDRPGDEAYYFEARNEQQLMDTFAAIIANLLCSVGPLAGALDRPDLLRAFLRNAAGVETPMVNRPNLADDAVARSLAFNYDPVERKVRLSRAACDEVTDNNQQVILRYGQTNLVSSNLR